MKKDQEIKTKAICIALILDTTPCMAYDVVIKNNKFWYMNDIDDFVSSELSCWTLIEVPDELNYNHVV